MEGKTSHCLFLLDHLKEITDYDWYAVDPNGYLVQFSSGGGTLPSSVASSSEALAQLHHYFLTLSTETTTAHFNPTLPVVVPSLSTSHAYNRYIQAYATSAKRGLFVFDKTDLADYDNYYHLVAYPARPLLLTELPPAIRALISRTRLPCAIAGITTLNANDIH